MQGRSRDSENVTTVIPLCGIIYAVQCVERRSTVSRARRRSGGESPEPGVKLRRGSMREFVLPIIAPCALFSASCATTAVVEDAAARKIVLEGFDAKIAGAEVSS